VSSEDCTSDHLVPHKPNSISMTKSVQSTFASHRTVPPLNTFKNVETSN
jgi:hypothetical protein